MGVIVSHHPAQLQIKRYGSVNFQALRPCVAAYRTRALGTIVRPATSTMGSPAPATTQSDEPFARLRTPQSFETYRSPFESWTMSVAGKPGHALGAAHSSLV